MKGLRVIKHALGTLLAGISLKDLEVHGLQHGLVGGRQDHRWSDSGLERLKPTIYTQAPTVAGFEARKVVGRNRSDQIIAPRSREFEKLTSYPGAEQVAAEIPRPGVAGAVAAKAGPGFQATKLQRLVQHIENVVAFINHFGCRLIPQSGFELRSGHRVRYLGICSVLQTVLTVNRSSAARA